MVFSIITIAFLAHHLLELFYTSNYNSSRYKRINRIVGIYSKDGV